MPSWEDAPDYYATFFEDADGIRLEARNFREIKRKVMYDWEARPGTTPSATPDPAARVRGSAMACRYSSDPGPLTYPGVRTGRCRRGP